MSKINNKIASILSVMILSVVASNVSAQSSPVIIIDNHGRPILIYNNPCNNKPYTVSPGVTVYPSPLIGTHCEDDNNQPQAVNPMVYPPVIYPYPYIPVPKTKEDALGGVGMGLGYGLGKMLK